MNKIKELIFHSPKKYIVLSIVGLLISLFYLINNKFIYMINYINAFFIGGAVIFFVGALSFVSYFGAFDLFSYNFKRFSKSGREKYKTLYDYSNIRKEERKKLNYPFIPYFIVGLIMIIISLVLRLF